MSMSDGQVNLSLTTTGSEQVSAALQKIKSDAAALGESVESSAASWRAQAAAVDKNRETMRAAAAAENEANAVRRQGRDEISRTSDALGDSIVRLRAQKELLQDPVFVSNLKFQKELRDEINALTKAQLNEEEAVRLTTRSRRELIVLAHELSQGRYKNFAGSLMVLEEGQGGITGALKGAITMMGGPYVAAAGAAALATVGVGAAMWKASEASAEMWHHMEMLGKAEGVSAQTMMGFQYLTVGTGISTEQLGNAFARFTQHLGTNSEKMRELGITAKEPLPAFEQLMEIIKNTPDASERARIANAALGEEWRRFIPVLEKGKQGAEAAIAAMQIPEGVQRDYERANQAQVKIDQSWMAIKLHSGEAFSGMRAGFKELEASALGFIANIASHKDDVPWLDQFLNRYFSVSDSDAAKGSYKQSIQDLIGSGTNSMQQQGYSEYMESQSPKGLTDEQKNIVKGAMGILKKDDLATALSEENAQFKQSRAILMSDHASVQELDEAHHKAVETLERAHQMRLADIRKQFSKKDTASAKFVEYHDPDQADRESRLKRQHAQALADRKSEAAAAANSEKIQLGWVGALTTAQKKQHDERMAAIQKEGDLIQGYASREISQALQGKLTIRAAEEDFTAFMADQFAERVTKWIEEEIIRAAFSEGEQATQLETTQAEASTAASSWSSAAVSASIATFGGAAAAGQAAYFQALASGQIAATAMAHARGGAVFGPVNASREEAFMPLVPGRIVPSYNSQTTNNNYGGNVVNHFHFHGGDERTILRTIRNANRDRRQASRV